MIKSFILTVVIVFPFTSEAFKVSPIELNFSNKGKGAVKTILVENTTDAKIPVEIFAYDRIHKEGIEKRVKTRDFYFFPKQFILKPGEKRNIRLSWMGLRSKTEPKDKKKVMEKGDTKIVQEQAYRLEVKQVPVDLKRRKNKTTGIKFLYNYVASLYVAPDRAKPQLKVINYKRVGTRKVEFNIQNVGSAHDILAHYNIKTKGKNPYVIDVSKQSDVVKGVNLLAGENRKILVDVPKGLPKSGLVFEIVKRK